MPPLAPPALTRHPDDELLTCQRRPTAARTRRGTANVCTCQACPAICSGSWTPGRPRERPPSSQAKPASTALLATDVGGRAVDASVLSAWSWVSSRRSDARTRQRQTAQSIVAVDRSRRASELVLSKGVYAGSPRATGSCRLNDGVAPPKGTLAAVSCRPRTRCHRSRATQDPVAAAASTAPPTHAPANRERTSIRCGFSVPAEPTRPGVSSVARSGWNGRGSRAHATRGVLPQQQVAERCAAHERRGSARVPAPRRPTGRHGEPALFAGEHELGRVDVGASVESLDTLRARGSPRPCRAATDWFSVEHDRVLALGGLDARRRLVANQLGGDLARGVRRDVFGYRGREEPFSRDADAVAALAERDRRRRGCTLRTIFPRRGASGRSQAGRVRATGSRADAGPSGGRGRKPACRSGRTALERVPRVDRAVRPLRIASRPSIGAVRPPEPSPSSSDQGGAEPPDRASGGRSEGFDPPTFSAGGAFRGVGPLDPCLRRQPPGSRTARSLPPRALPGG
jgi:hypothetical protein